MDMLEAFTSEIYVAPIYDVNTIRMVINEVRLFGDREMEEFIQQLQLHGVPLTYEVNNKFSIGIKKILQLTETARQSDTKVETLTDAITRASREL